MIIPGLASRRILFLSELCYFCDSGASVASRATLEALARHGWASEVLCGSTFEGAAEIDLADRFARWGIVAEPGGGGAWSAGAGGVVADVPPHWRIDVRGVEVTIHQGPSTRPREPDAAEAGDFLRLLDATLARFRPDLVIGYGGGRLAREAFARAKARGAAVVFHLHNFLYHDAEPFAHADAVLVPSRFAAEFYREALGVDATALPYLIDPERVRAGRREPKYLTFVNPSHEKGVYAFARIADELGRRRPEIPILVVEARGTEATVAGCGLDLRARGNVFFLANTPDPRRFWGVSRACLMPSLWWESQGLAAVEAMANGIPVIASDRGALPETLGGAGLVLPLPDRITPATRWLPTAEEVAPWVAAIERLWDDGSFYEDQSRQALDRAAHWDPVALVPRYVEFLESVLARRDAKPAVVVPPGRAKAVVLVPHLSGIEWECEQSLRRLEAEGVRVVRREGSSQIDVVRNELASNALHDGFESLLFIDADIGFQPADALRLLARPEPVVAGVYAKKGRRELASRFADGIDEIAFGTGARGLYPLKYAATGFLRIRAGVLRRMIEELSLPLCNAAWGRGAWPFFQPLVVADGDGFHYLGEDWSFSHRLGQVGVTPMADTTIRLWHYGRYGYGWEDAGSDPGRFPSYRYRVAPALGP